MAAKNKNRELRRAKETRKLMKLGLNIRWLRAKRGWTQKQLGVKAGIDQTYISGIELARREGNPSLIAISRIAHALGVPLRVLCSHIDD